jgi:predicted aminopeptidase
MALMAFLAIWSIGAAQVPSGFPVMPNTGNPAADLQNYETAKTAFYAAHPEYLQGGNSNVQAVNVPMTAQEKAVYEANKTAQAESVVAETRNEQASALLDSPVEEESRNVALAETQKRQMQQDFSLNKASMYNNNVALYNAYVEWMDALTTNAHITLTNAQVAALTAEQLVLFNSYPKVFIITN